MSYKNSQVSKTGYPVPIFDTGLACNSLYDPVTEAVRRIDILEKGFVVFAGIGGGFLIREYLKKFQDSKCLVIESSTENVSQLRELIPIEDILHNPKIIVIDNPYDTHCIEKTILTTYQPSIDGGFSLVELTPWSIRHPTLIVDIKKTIEKILKNISADYSVQSHFGKLWLRNIIKNFIFFAGEHTFLGIPKITDAKKIALVVAAGPSLEEHFEDIRTNRESYILFSTDTAYPALRIAGIVADYFISIDGQAISSSHIHCGLHTQTTLILDICANPVLARIATIRGCPVYFFAGAHPLAQYIAKKGYLPSLITGSGTVTVSAKGVATSLGYTNIRCIGADFAYTGGKPYTRGTYLGDFFHNNSNRCTTSETHFSQLLFRTPVISIKEKNSLTYKTEILERYKQEFSQFQNQSKWLDFDLQNTDAHAFFMEVQKELIQLQKSYKRDAPIIKLFLPFFAWHRKNFSQKAGDWKVEFAIKLALDLIARYTEKS